ncbi:MFS transporter [Reinekea sp.]|uniref:MFS transporter n=1 Tax=Reinekea sp. TaxID=1970455 RepID=UPI00236F2AF3|nr:MFS transporter [Reinekea sp.]MDB9894696.1 MFS transporter [Reinekea forsetii]
MQQSGYLKLLKSKDYVPFFISQVLTNLSDGLLAVAIVYFAIQLQASPWQLGVITFFVTLSRGFLGPLGGLISDRMNKKTYLIGIEICRTLLMAGAFVLYINDLVDIWGLMVIGTLVSTLFAISVPAAKAIIPKLVADHELQLANGLIQTVTWPAFFLGSGFLAIIITTGITAWTFLLVALAFLLSSILLLFIPLQATQPRSSGATTKLNMMTELLQGYRELKSDSVIHARVWAYGIFTFFWRGTLQILIPLAVISTLNSPAWVYGALMFVNGVAELIANLVVGKMRFHKPLVFTFLCEILIGLGLLAIFAAFALPVPEVGVFIGVILIGIAAATIDIPLLTVIQKNVAEQNVGKVISYWFTIGSAGGALGNLFMGLYFEFVPIQIGTAILGAIVFLLGLQMMAWARRNNTFEMPVISG